jgi:diguanylate cyclase (GGDEF)-like protein/PAS domain S-box-containing protein
MDSKQISPPSQAHVFESRCFSLFEQAGIGVLVTDLQGTITNGNRLLPLMVGYPNAELTGRQVSDLFSPKDAPLINEIYQICDGDLGDCRKLEKSCIRKDGQVFWYKLTACLSQDGYSPARELVFLIEDITDRKTSEEKLRESEEKYRDLFENANDLIQCVAPDGHFVYVNHAWRESLGYEACDLEQLTAFDILAPESVEHCSDIFQKLMTGVRVDRVEAAFIAKNGTKILVEGSLSTRFEDGKPVSTRGIFRDITVRKQHEERLHYLSTHDPLTGLTNRAYFEESLINLESSSLYPITIVIADVDGLKQVNDRFGHTVGDEILQAAARLLEKAFPNSLIMARMGGDEFAIVFTGVDELVIRQQIAQVRQKLLAEKCHSDTPTLCISMGSAMGLQGDDLRTVLKRADLDMYTQKSRSCTHRYSTQEIVENCSCGHAPGNYLTGSITKSFAKEPT